MIYFLMYFGVFGVLASIVSIIIMIAYKKERLQIPIICLILSFVISAIGAHLYGGTDEYKKNMEQKTNNQNDYTKKQSEIQEEQITEPQQEESSQTESESESEEEEQTEISIEDLTEDEYKEQCNEMFYDDIFFSKESFEGKYVKLNLFFSEKYFFTVDDMYTDSTQKFYKENNLYRDFYKCCVLREGTNSYVGQQIDVFFTQDYELNPSDYKTGQKVIMYGKVVHCNTKTWNGYNTVYFIPKYIDEQ